MEVERSGSEARTIWILTHGRLGDLGQMQELALALRWPATVKRLVFHPPNIPFLATLLLDRRRSDALEPPWPDVVFCAEGLTSVIARLLKRKSRGAIRTVCIGRPAGTPLDFDLVLTTAQYRLPKAPQVVELGLPIAPHIAKREGRAASADTVGIGKLARPFTTVLIGGTSLPDWLDEAVASRLAKDLLVHVQKKRGTLLVSTSPRTGKAATSALAKVICTPHVVHPWHSEGENPYQRFLEFADEIVVTSDSVSMVVDALVTGKPVSVYRLDQRRSVWHRLIERLHERAWVNPMPSFWIGPIKWLLDQGIIELRAERRLLFDRLAAKKRLSWFNEGAPSPTPSTYDAAHVEEAVARVRDLFSSTR